MNTAENITYDLCKVCNGRVECAPTAILLITLVHTLYGTLGPDINHLGTNKNQLHAAHFKDEPHEPNEETPGYKFRGEKRKQKSVFDFIVVGGGTAGCVIASRLSENKNWRVLLIEAGYEEHKLTLIPGLTSEFQNSCLDWKFTMRPKKTFCQQRGDSGCDIIQGKGLGGTSSINNMAYMRGSPADYDEWAFNGNDGWSFNDVLPYFKYSEGNYDKDISKNKYFHSTQGPLDVGRYAYVDENVDILLSALNELGLNYTDINGKKQLGFMRLQTNTFDGERVSAYRAFIDPVRSARTNLKIITEALVTKIIIERHRNSLKAVGVEFIKNGTKTNVFASKEVIVCAGAINSPKLLMQSGIGPKEYLQYLGLKVHSDLPVGSNLQDHLSVCLPVINLSKTGTNTKFMEKLKDISMYYTKGIGPLSANFQVAAFLETSLSDILNTPDIEIRFKGYNSNMYYNKIVICVSLLTPKSRGHIVLNASDPIFGQPLIYPNFLKEISDTKKLMEGLQKIVRIFDTEVFKTAKYDFDPMLILNNECKNHESVSEAFWACIIGHFSSPLHNYVGTCKMGSSKDSESVVDPTLRVFGIAGLRVADSSVIPTITRGSTSAPVIMIAEKASDLIKDTWY